MHTQYKKIYSETSFVFSS